LTRLLSGLLIAAVLYSIGLILVHDHAGSDYRPTCPACHQERAIGSSSGPVAVAVVVPSLLSIETLDAPDADAERVNAAFRPSSPRSPPLPL